MHKCSFRYFTVVRRFLALVAVLAQASTTAGQDTRVGTIEQQEAERAKVAAPPVRSRAERVFDRIRNGMVESPDGFFPYFDTVYSGGGITLGAGYRTFVGDRSTIDVRGLYSVKHYKLIESTWFSPAHWAERLDLGARVGWRDATQVSYYGTGMVPPDQRARFRMQQGYGAFAATLRPVTWVVLQGTAGVDDYTLLDPTGGKPPIDELFDPATVPGYGASPTYAHFIGTTAIDWRPAVGYARTGGYYGVTVNRYQDTDDTYDFSQLDANVIQHIPILRENWVISLRGRVQTILDDSDVVPYFLLPSLGSGSTLRAYSSFRFRDRHSLLTQAELRWAPSRLGLDMALFYDAGKVTHQRSDLDFDGLTHNWGVGARLHGPAFTPVRVELAKGREGWNLVFSGNAVF